MKRTLLITLLAATASLWSVNAIASHIAGAEITYECVGQDSFLVKLQLYRDCSGINAPTSASAGITSVSCAQSLNTPLTLMNPGGTELSTLCPVDQVNTTCSLGWLPGLKVYRYEGIVHLPASCDDWVFAYSLCCRNTATNTTGQPAMYVEATLDNLNFTCNSSPLFVAMPVPFVCMNTPYCFNNGALDANMDSLVYKLIDPMVTDTSVITFIPPFTANDPIGGTVINPVTGNVCFTGTQIGKYNMAVRVEEWSGNMLKGSVMRDMQIILENCGAASTTIVGQVTDTTGAPVNAADVDLYEYNISQAAMVLAATTTVNGNGDFAFNNYPFGQYVVQAHPDTTAYPNHVPTYADSAFQWQFANISYSTCTPDTMNIKLRGVGQLSPLAWLTGNFANSPQKTGAPAPLEGIDIFLLRQNDDQLIAFAETDANGDYTFQVPYGNYYIYVDITGVVMDSTYFVSLSAGNPSETGLNYWTDSVWIYKNPPPVGIEQLEDGISAMKVFPNPYVGLTNIVVIDDGAVTLEVFNLLGSKVHTIASQVEVSGSKTFTFSATGLGLSPGTYILRLNTGDRIETKRLIETR